ncbi:hypothetical protein J5690_06870 [bacterium]|nr:hypothetical protein [bacterium]
MKLNGERLVPFSTVILTKIDKYEDLSAQIKEWCESDSFNPQGKAYLVDCDRNKARMFSIENKITVTFEDEYSFFELVRFIQKAKPSCIIDFCNNMQSRTIVYFSHAGCAICKKSLFSLFFAEAGYKKEALGILKKAVPCFFNDHEKETRFVYRSTSYTEIPAEFVEQSEEEVEKEEKLVIDLGGIPERPSGRILWVPKRTTARGMWADFKNLTYFAEKENVIIDVHLKNEKSKKRFDSVFFIKGRKMDLDRYLNPIVCENLSDAIFEKSSPEYRKIIFSFGLTPEFFKVKSFLKQLGKDKNSDNSQKLTTMKKIGNYLK